MPIKTQKTQTQTSMTSMSEYAHVNIDDFPLLYACKENDSYKSQRQIALDFDSILFPFIDAMSHLPGGEKISIGNCTDWNSLFDLCGSEQKALAMFDMAMEYEYMRKYSPFDGAVHAIQTLQEFGVKVHLMTTRDPKFSDDTVQWLNDHNIKVDSFNCDLHTNKVEACLAKQIPVIVDDRPLTIEEALEKGLRPLTLSWPYNKNTVTTRNLYSAENWPHLVRGILATIEQLISEEMDKK